MARWSSRLGSAGGIFLGCVLMVATVAKAVEPGAFAEQIRLEELDFLLPATPVVLIALGLEAVLGSLLLLGLRPNWVLFPVTGLVAFFVFLTGRNYWLVSRGLRSEEAACGCFGSLLERTPAEAFWQDLLLLVPALGLAYLGRRPASRGLPRVRLAVAAVALVVVVAYAGTRPDLRFSRLAAEIAGEVQTGGERFQPTGDYRLVRGEEVLEARIYHSVETVTLMVLGAGLPEGVLLRVRTATVQTFDPARLQPAGGGALAMAPDTLFREAGTFTVDGQGISFALAGASLQLRSGEETSGSGGRTEEPLPQAPR